MKTKRRLKLVQHISTGKQPTFAVCETVPGANYYHARIIDRIQGDEPEFVLKLQKDRKHWPSPEMVAIAASRELNESLGFVILTRFIGGVPEASAIYTSNTRQVLCLWSTSPDAPVNHPAVTDSDGGWGRAMLAINEARRQRGESPICRDSSSLRRTEDDVVPLRWIQLGIS